MLNVIFFTFYNNGPGKIGGKNVPETIKYVNITHLILNSEAAAIKYTLVYVPA